MRLGRMLLLALALAGCEQAPDHCRLSQVDDLPVGDVERNEWWLPGTLSVASTVEWPACPPLDSSTTEKVEGPRITYPGTQGRVADGLWPVILFGHANSARVCNPSDRYRSLHEQWASWGWVVYSVDASEQNCRDYSVEQMRERIAQHELAFEDLRHRNDDPDSPFYGRLNLGVLIAAGHSRGGATAMVLASEDERYAGAITLQGGNPSRFKLGDTYTSQPVLGVTAELDRDLRFPHVDLSEELAQGRYSWHTVLGGTHAQTADGLQRRDVDPLGIPRSRQIEQTKYLTTAFLAAEFSAWDGSQMRQFVGAQEVLYSPAGAEVSRSRWAPGFVSRWSRGDEAWLHRFDVDTSYVSSCEGLRCELVPSYAPEKQDEKRRGFRLSTALLLEAVDGEGRFNMQIDSVPADQPGLRLQARVRALEPETRFEIVFVTPEGEVSVNSDRAAPGLGERFAQLDAAVPGELSDQISIVLLRGALIVDDVRFTSP